jgi:hypothetical protein
MESSDRPKVEYSAAIEGIRAFQGKIKEIDGVICELEKTIEKNDELIQALSSPEMLALTTEYNKQENMGKLLQEYEQKISVAKESIANLKQCRETLMSEIGLNIASEKSMQKVMDMPPQGRA